MPPLVSDAPVRRFTLGQPGALDQLVAGLQARATFERDADRRVQRRVFDTFDWRLFRQGTVLELVQPAPERRGAVESATHPEVVWRSTETGEVLGRFPLAEVPRFARDLPAGPVADRLADVLDVRALLPLADLTTTTVPLRLVDDEGKTVARVAIDEPEGAELPTVVEVAPLRGYERAAQELVDLLGAQVVLAPGGEDVALAAVRAAGHRPGSYTSKLKLALDPGATALEAWLAVARALLEAVEANEEGVRADLDPEFLHDLRVAVRRARSVLGQAKSLLAPEVLEPLRAELAWLGQLTGPTRDLDVYLLELPRFEAGLPADRQADLGPFHDFLRAGQRQAHAELTAGLASDRYRALRASWRALVDQPPDPAAAGPEAARPAPEVAAARIAKAHKRLVRDGRAIDERSHPERLHDLRKDAKKLRYLLECFGSLFDAEAVQPVVRQLKGLQDVLGEYQDCQVQAGSLGEFADRMLGGGGVPAATLLAMGFLVDQLADREAAAREAFGPSFERFDEKDVRHAVRDLGRQAQAAPTGGGDR